MTTMTTRQYADALSTTPKELRKFLRSVTPRDEQPGKGGRWELPGDKRSISTARKSFAKWQKDQADAAAERAAQAAKDAAAAVEDAEGTDEDSTEDATD